MEDPAYCRESFWVRACEYCYTDPSLGFVDLPDNRGRVCVMTTWKDLGDGQKLDNREWQSHLDAADSTWTKVRKWNTEPWIYQAFEKNQSMDAKVSRTFQYYPSIRQKSLTMFAKE